MKKEQEDSTGPNGPWLMYAEKLNPVKAQKVLPADGPVLINTSIGEIEAQVGEWVVEHYDHVNDKSVFDVYPDKDFRSRYEPITDPNEQLVIEKAEIACPKCGDVHKVKGPEGEVVFKAEMDRFRSRHDQTCIKQGDRQGKL